MVVREVRRPLKRACFILFWAAVSLIAPHHGYAEHILDERPGLGTGMTIILSLFWVSVVSGIVFLVRRLMRPKQGWTDNAREKNDQETKGEKSTGLK